MNTETKYLLYFIGGVIWAAATSRKAYAPGYNQSDMMSSLELNTECPPGMEKKPIRRPQYGTKPSPEREQRDRIQWQKAQQNAPCISSKEAQAIRDMIANAPLKA